MIFPVFILYIYHLYTKLIVLFLLKKIYLLTINNLVNSVSFSLNPLVMIFLWIINTLPLIILPPRILSIFIIFIILSTIILSRLYPILFLYSLLFIHPSLINLFYYLHKCMRVLLFVTLFFRLFSIVNKVNL